MGYYIDQIEANFEIKKELQKDALEAVRQLASNASSNFAWVDSGIVADAKSLSDALDEWRWRLIFDEDGNVNDICFEGEKLGDEETLFNAIAPYVTRGSYIEMSGEEGCMWRWVFDGEKCNEIYPKIIW